MSTDAQAPRVRSTLIIDDHLPDVVWSRRVLERSGRYLHVDAVSSGEAALAWLDERAAPVLVLLDINMPGMDGFGFLAAVQARRAELEARGAMPAVVMLSSSDDPSDITRSHGSEFVVDYLVKPLTREDADALADRFGSSGT